MGTHPIFESDFDCLTEGSNYVNMPQVGSDKEVTRVDQDKINLFSRMNQRMTDIEDANEIVENLQIVEEDAPVYFRIGECFMLQTCDDIGEMIEGEKKKLESELSKYESEKKSTESEMNKLKVSLYAKFGDQIHLERE